MYPSVLLHACCAPCATVGVPALLRESGSLSLYFYGGNIHPRDELLRRLDSLRVLADAYGAELLYENRDDAEWSDTVRGLEREREGGKRCEACVKLQLESAARAARGLEIRFLCTSLTMSPQKDPALINLWGAEIARRYGLVWIERVWRKKNGFLESARESRRLSLYRQNYCGCRFSLAAARERIAADDPSGSRGPQVGEPSGSPSRA